jgi:hypothetical protein
MKKKLIYTISCGILILSGCMSSLQPLASTAIPATKDTNHTQPPVIQPTLTNMPLVPLPTAAIRLVEPACLSIQSDLPAKYSYEGNLLLIDIDPEAPSEDWLSLYKTHSEESILLPYSFPETPVVSPNRTQFAVESSSYEERSIEIFSTSGEIIKSIPMQENWGWLADWINNKQIGIVMAEPSDNPRYDKYPASVLILDPFTEQIQVLLPDYPYIDRANQMTNFGGLWGSTIYDPNLSLVVYAGARNLSGYLLYSLTDEKILAEIPGLARRALPIWFSNGMQFIVLGEDFYKVSASGETEKITWFNPNYDFDKYVGWDYFIKSYYSLSPNENLLAFWFGRHEENISWDQTTFTLAILNLETGEIIDTCILLSKYTYEHSSPFPYPIWSPDSKKLLVSARYPQEGKRDLVLIDLEKYAAYQLHSDLIPAGWLVADE